MAGVTGKGKRGNFVIVNLQKTPLDYLASMVIHAKIDDFFKLLMKKLNMEIPTFKLDRWASIKIEETHGKTYKETVKVQGLDPLGGPFELFKGTNINGRNCSSTALTADQMKEDSIISVTLKWQGHYNEADLNLAIPRALLKANDNQIKLNMIFNPYAGQQGAWEPVEAFTAKKVTLGMVKSAQGAKAAAPVPTAVKQVE